MQRLRVAINPWCGTFAVAGLISAGLRPVQNEPIPVLISGDIQGYLAPCGCTSPMTGGIRRLATAVADNRGPDGIFLENGGLVESQPPNGPVGRAQNVLKLQTLAEALAAMKIDAINLGDEEAAGGLGVLMELAQLSNGHTLSSSVAASPTNKLPRWIVRGPLLIGGITPAAGLLAQVTGETSVSPNAAVADLVGEAARVGKSPVLMIRGGMDEAKSLAAAFPALTMIVYSGSGTAPAGPITVGNTVLITPGDHAKNLVRVEFSEGRFSNYRVFTLTPAYADNSRVARLYKDYLKDVDRAHLIEGLTRTKGPAFAGSQTCMRCHEKAFTIWRHSAHSSALNDLERQGHARDPDCLECHVTGLESRSGFYTRQQTPNLSDVTCESCHGPAKAHALSPKVNRLPRLEPSSCLKCHGSENSPNFNFKTYWAKISHR